MNKASRLTLFIFILGLFLFLGLVFSGWVVPNIIRPAADTAWLFLRVFILSTDQVYYWVVLCFAVVILVIYRLSRVKRVFQPQNQAVSNEIVENLKNWQDLLVSAKQANGSQAIAKDKILRLVVAHYLNKLPGTNQAEIVQDLEQRQLSLPGSVHDYLFSTRLPAANGSLLHIVNQYVRRWYRRFAGTDGVEFDRMIDELVDFLKT